MGQVVQTVIQFLCGLACVFSGGAGMALQVSGLAVKRAVGWQETRTFLWIGIDAAALVLGAAILFGVFLRG